MIAALRLPLVLLFFVLYALVVWVPLMLHASLTGAADRLYRAGVRDVKLSLGLAGVRVRCEGLENIPRAPCVFAPNHTSIADPPALLAALPRRISILVKKELFRIPILGAAMKLVRFVPVDRADREAAAGSVDLAVQYLGEGLSFVVYPEGTRSLDGRLGTFKKGAFILAIRAGVPVVPISIVGAEKVMPRGSRGIHPGEVLIRFHPPVDSSGYTLEEKDRLLDCVRAAIASGLPPELKPLESREAQGAAYETHLPGA
jgi:1-acyl-sn-glycerol-3-phosphate acyltransferase